MSKLISEVIKVNTPIVPFTLVATIPVSSRGYELSDQRKAMFCARFRNIVSADNDITFSVLEATDIAGTTARNIGNALTTANITISAHTSTNSITLTMNSPDVADVLTINGLIFTAAAAEVLATRTFDQSGNVAAQAASLVACINAAFNDLVATTDGASTVTIQSAEPGETTVTVADITSEARIIPVTDEAVGYIEVDSATLSDGYNRLVARVTPGAVATAITGDITLLRGNGRYIPVTQQSADSDIS